MSVASKKRRRWARLLRRTEQERDARLRAYEQDIRRQAAAAADRMPADELERRTQEAVNGLIVEPPWRIVFHEKRRAQRAKYPRSVMPDLARSVARTLRAGASGPVHVSVLEMP